MKNRRKKDVDPKIKKMKELHSILDRNYFHVTVGFDEKYIEGVKWKVYYSNLPTQQYYSNKNKELLSSDENTIEDIYKLKSKFEKEKAKIINENAYEYAHISNTVFYSMYETKKKFIDIITDLMILMTFANIVNLFIFESLEFSMFSMLYIAILTILSSYKLEQINKIRKKGIHDVQENYIRERIRRQGLYFMKRLKDEA